MEALLHRTLPARHAALLMQFLRFGVVGATGFVVDTAVVYATRHWLGLYGAGLLAYFVGATSNWAVNRAWTFRGLGGGPLWRQWALFMVANTPGFVLNRGGYAALVTLSAFCAENPAVGVLAGSLCGMLANFSLSKRLVFRTAAEHHHVAVATNLRSAPVTSAITGGQSPGDGWR